jgi:hypothetical protein
MKNGGVSYNITGGSLVNSTDYAPSDGIPFSSTIITKAAAKKILIDTSTIQYSYLLILNELKA